MGIHCRIVLIFLSTIICNANEIKQPHLGMWAWKQSHFDTVEAQDAMLIFCAAEGISHIDQHIGIKNGVVQNAKAAKQLVIKASKHSVTVNFLRGDHKMFFEKNHVRTLEDLKVIIEFNKQLPSGAKLAGVKFDVELYLTPEWKVGGKQREKLQRDYLVFLQLASKQLKGTGLELSVDVPFWWDKPMYEIDFNGHNKPFAQHIQDSVDWISIMSYRREPQLVLQLVQGELAYAQQSGKLAAVAPGLETIKISGKEAFVSFGNLPPEQFRKALAELRKELASNQHIRCIMLHDYESLKTYLKATDNKAIKQKR